jgi:hypothetical protein
VESLKKDVDVKFNTMMASSSAQAAAIEDLRSMF